MDLRKIIDITPWDKKGFSFMGLTRTQAKTLASIFIIVGILLAIPPIIPDPTDIAVLWIGTKIVERTDYTLVQVLLFIYTAVAWGLILLGIWIYPYHSGRMFNGCITRIKREIKSSVNLMLQNPAVLIIVLIVFYLIIQWYKSQL